MIYELNLSSVLILRIYIIISLNFTAVHKSRFVALKYVYIYFQLISWINSGIKKYLIPVHLNLILVRLCFSLCRLGRISEGGSEQGVDRRTSQEKTGHEASAANSAPVAIVRCPSKRTKCCKDATRMQGYNKDTQMHSYCLSCCLIFVALAATTFIL